MTVVPCVQSGNAMKDNSTHIVTQPQNSGHKNGLSGLTPITRIGGARFCCLEVGKIQEPASPRKAGSAVVFDDNGTITRTV